MKLKKLASLLLALVMALALAVPAMASGNTGSITINDAVKGQDYKAYKIFDVVYDSGTPATAFNYTIAKDSPWYDTVAAFATAENGLTLQASVSDADNMTVIVDTEKFTEAKAAEFAKALRTALDNGVTDTSAKAFTVNTTTEGTGEEATEKTTATVTGLELGYYFVTSTTGTVCSLDTTQPNVEMQEKNEVPTSDKEVKGDDGNYGDSNTAKIGDTVEFKVTIKAQPGAQNYVFHDEMTEGLTFDASSLKVMEGTEELDTPGDYTLKTTDLTDGCTFEVEFTKTYLDTITAKNTEIVLTYNATLNEKAFVGTPTGEETGNVNTGKLEYGDKNKDNFTPEDKTTTYTYSFDLVKTDKDKKVLTGAQFELYTADQVVEADGKVTLKEGATAISLIKDAATGNYRVAKKDETGTTTIDAGKPTISGLSTGTYYLKETKQPDGYNILADLQKVEIGSANNSAILNEAGDTYVSDGVQVINNTGAELPSTGGIGTTIFYIVGGVLAAGAVILLITKRRMNMDK